MKVLLIISLLTLPYFGQSQKDRHIWFFGEGAAVDFLDDTIKKRDDGSIHTKEGCSTMCDDDGNLLFTVEPLAVRDSAGNIMFGSYGIKAGYSSSNASVSVKLPGSENLYYIFTSREYDDFYEPGGVWYSIVDMEEEYGLGDVITLNAVLKDSTTEKICLVPHDNGTDYWIVIRPFDIPAFYAYQLSSEGISTDPVKSFIGELIPAYFDEGIGCIKASLDGTLIAAANYLEEKVEIYDFDNSSGELSNLRTLEYKDTSFPYGIEFSSNNKFLYVSTVYTRKIYQYEIENNTEAEIEASKYEVATANFSLGALQIGPDSCIYNAQFNNWFLPCIEYPNEAGAACGYDSTKVQLTWFTNAQFGLPLWIPQNKPEPEPVIYIPPPHLLMPTGFTPNNDGFNDVFKPKEIENLYNVKIEIFNRWGDIVYKSDDINLGWNGTFKGKRTVDGTYFWVACGENELGRSFSYKGTIDMRR